MNVSTILLVALAALVLWLILIYNKLVKYKNMAEEGWSGIDVQLKRRTDLIPNILESVKGYLTHEKIVLREVTDLRARSLTAQGVDEKIQAETALSRSLTNLFAVAEAYPDLKANQNFLQLQSQLGEIEEQIQAARRYFNGTVRNLNILIESFPARLVASTFGFQKREFFEIEDAKDREVPRVQF
jgi:LemA protein